MNCPQCNASLLPDAKFCGACGFRMQSAPPPSPINLPPPTSVSAPIAPEKTANFVDQPIQTPPPNPFEQTVQTPPPPSFNQSPPPNHQGATTGGTFHVDTDGRGTGRGYSWEVQHGSSFALAIVNLQAGQSISAEAGAMVSMSGNVELQSQMKGGIFGALKRAVGGESAFVSTFTASGAAGEVTLAPGMPGDIAGIEMQNQTFMVQASSYLAGDTSLQVETKFGGLKSWVGGEGLFLLSVSGSGLLLISSFGAIHRKKLQPGERYNIDTGHLVAWEGQMQYNLKKAARGFFASILSGEGLVAEFQGPGEILIQTRNLAAFAGLLKPFFPSQGGSGGGGGGFNVNFGN